MANPNSMMQKPILLKKYMRYQRFIMNNKHIGTYRRGLLLNFDNTCNFNCQHCFAQSSKGTKALDINGNERERLTIGHIKRIADEAHELGVYELDIQGGEPLLNPLLFDIIDAFGAERFYIYVTTNGFLLDKEYAKRLAATGIDRVTVSLDSTSSEQHDTFRRMPGAYNKAIDALHNVVEAGMRGNINFTVGHYNARSGELERICELAKNNHFTVAFNAATPTGSWFKKFDVMLDAVDTAHLMKLRKTYPFIIRDLYNYHDINGVTGCSSVNNLYINPYGDVLPCPYIHTKIGNIMESSLSEIYDYGFTVKHFNKFSQYCLAGEDRGFAMKYLSHEMSIMNPIAVNNLFTENDFIDG